MDAEDRCNTFKLENKGFILNMKVITTVTTYTLCGNVIVSTWPTTSPKKKQWKYCLSSAKAEQISIWWKVHIPSLTACNHHERAVPDTAPELWKMPLLGTPTDGCTADMKQNACHSPGRFSQHLSGVCRDVTVVAAIWKRWATAMQCLFRRSPLFPPRQDGDEGFQFNLTPPHTHTPREMNSKWPQGSSWGRRAFLLHSTNTKTNCFAPLQLSCPSSLAMATSSWRQRNG